MFSRPMASVVRHSAVRMHALPRAVPRVPSMSASLGAPVRRLGIQPVTRVRGARFCSNGAAKVRAETQVSFLKQCQVDSGFWQGLVLGGGVAAYLMLVSKEERIRHVQKLLAWWRRVGGVSEDLISDKQLLGDFLERNLVAALNVTLASPAFYFMWHLIHDTPLHITFIRSLTGTVRIIPFMGIFYSLLGVGGAVLTNYFMKGGSSYEDAKSNANAAFLLSGLVALEAVVELRGCGVPFANMSPMAFAVFLPVLVGRLVSGVFIQQQKVGSTDSSRLLPDSWENGSAAQKQLVAVTDALALDQTFLITVVGTTVFQHILNGVTYVLLEKGRFNVLRNLGAYLTGGLNGTAAGAVQLLARTFMMRFFFVLTWNWCSSNDLHVFDFVTAAADAPKLTQ